MKRNILLTGACGGIGSAIYDLLQKKGHRVIGIGKHGPDHAIDFNKEHVTDSFVTEFSQYLGYFDVLINCAGVMELNKAEAFSGEQLRRSLRVNLEVPFLLMREFIKKVKAEGPLDQDFRVVNIASMAIKLPGRECPGYAASKAGLEVMTRALAKEYAATPLVFANVCPNSVEGTAMSEQGLEWLTQHRGMTPHQAEQYTDGMLRRKTLRTEVAEVVRWAVEDMPAAMTGTSLWMPAACGL